MACAAPAVMVGDPLVLVCAAVVAVSGHKIYYELGENFFHKGGHKMHFGLARPAEMTANSDPHGVSRTAR